MAEHVSFLTREIFIVYFFFSLYIYIKFTRNTKKLNMDRRRASNIVILKRVNIDERMLNFISIETSRFFEELTRDVSNIYIYRTNV